MLRQVFKCLFRISSKDFGCRLFLLFMANRRCSIEGKNGYLLSMVNNFYINSRYFSLL